MMPKIGDQLAWNFITAFESLQDIAREISDANGFDSIGQADTEKIALMHSELSEALEAMRHGNPPSDHIPAFTGVEEEMADVIIRVMLASHVRGWRTAEAVIEKVEFNSTRPHKHGGKLF